MLLLLLILLILFLIIIFLLLLLLPTVEVVQRRQPLVRHVPPNARPRASRAGRRVAEFARGIHRVVSGRPFCAGRRTESGNGAGGLHPLDAAELVLRGWHRRAGGGRPADWRRRA